MSDKSPQQFPPKRHHVIEFRYAVQGLLYALKTQPNFVVHTLMAVIVLIAAYIYHLEKTEILLLIVMVSGVMMAELLNTALETVVDLVTEDYHPKAKIAKDLSAAGVFILSFGAFFVGLIIFLPRIF